MAIIKWPEKRRNNIEISNLTKLSSHQGSYLHTDAVIKFRKQEAIYVA